MTPDDYTIILGHRSRCNTTLEAVRSNHSLKGCTESDEGQSQHRVLPSACRFKPALLPGISRDKKQDQQESQLSIHACHQITGPPFFNVPHWHCMWKICSHRPLSQQQQQQLKNTSWSINKCAIRHVATSQGQEDPTREGQRAKCDSCLVNKCGVKWTTSKCSSTWRFTCTRGKRNT